MKEETAVERKECQEGRKVTKGRRKECQEGRKDGGGEREREREAASRDEIYTLVGTALHSAKRVV